jgi:hypothetical protein
MRFEFLRANSAKVSWLHVSGLMVVAMTVFRLRSGVSASPRRWPPTETMGGVQPHPLVIPPDVDLEYTETDILQNKPKAARIARICGLYIASTWLATANSCKFCPPIQL